MFLVSLWGAISQIVYLVGAVCAIWCVWDLFANKNLDIIWKILLTILIIATSWIGLLVYYFIIRDRIPGK